jgi:electron transfer flavoprotein beta subunit
VLLGQQSDDGECYTIGAVVAEHLRMPSLTQVIRLEVAPSGSGGAATLTCERQAEYGYDTVEVDLPAVISVGDAINEPRYPSLKAIMGAKKKPLEKLDVAGAGLDAGRVGADGSMVACGEFKDPPAKQGGTIIEDEDTDATVEQIIAWLDERKLLA